MGAALNHVGRGAILYLGEFSNFSVCDGLAVVGTPRWTERLVCGLPAALVGGRDLSHCGSLPAHQWIHAAHQQPGWPDLYAVLQFWRLLCDPLAEQPCAGRSDYRRGIWTSRWRL